MKNNDNKVLKTCLTVFAAIVLLAVSFSAGVGTGLVAPQLFEPKSTATPDAPVIVDTCPPCEEGEETICPTQEECPSQPVTTSPQDLNGLFAPFWETWQIVHDQYVDQPVDDTLLMQGAIQGMLESLGDKHTGYMTPDEFKRANEDLVGEYEGIGAWVDTSGDYVEIISPMSGSPADKAGLLPRDQVIAINGDDMTGIPGDIVLKSILGPAGTDVTITIKRGDLEPFDVTITRAKITVPTIDAEMLENDIAYIALYTFGDNSTAQLQKGLKELLAQNPKGLILDLRGNGGGYLITAIEVVSEFIDKGTVMYEEYGDGEIYSYDALPGGLATKIPLVVLVDAGTASASEIVAGAIQDMGRGVLVGTVTYGKGTVQNWIALKNEQGGVRVTIARWLTPDKRQISEVGLTPEYIIEFTEEDIEAGVDVQLEKAIEVLLEMTK